MTRCICGHTEDMHVIEAEPPHDAYCHGVTSDTRSGLCQCRRWRPEDQYDVGVFGSLEQRVRALEEKLSQR
jgi:phage terminase large subunit-like protein